MWPDMALSCTDGGWQWPGMAGYLRLLAPYLAPLSAGLCAAVSCTAR